MQQNSKNENETSQKLCPDIDRFWPNVGRTAAKNLGTTQPNFESNGFNSPMKLSINDLLFLLLHQLLLLFFFFCKEGRNNLAKNPNKIQFNESMTSNSIIDD